MSQRNRITSVVKNKRLLLIDPIKEATVCEFTHRKYDVFMKMGIIKGYDEEIVEDGGDEEDERDERDGWKEI